ncbi:MAG: UDP-N-acetylmuramoyl-tripeptide--D-alanyl-D-alanine ligase [Lachnospiraceae bacterium]|nr:UDP-N-acetylmuramoyl-tripeptide--D-alanyl-D-alanine ligase [Lachnospiraceae bacterium]
MKNMTLQNIADCLNRPLINGAGKEDVEITGAELDSRKIAPGYLFFATRGERVDGHDFIPQAVKKGAVLIICEKEPGEMVPGVTTSGEKEPGEERTSEKISSNQVPYIQVEDSFLALKQVAAFYRRQLTIPVVGVTGSVGKTSTREIIAAALSGKYRVLRTEGNFNNEVGLPLTLLRIREEHEAAVVEMGINHFGEMERLTDIARPDIAVITNIGQCHLENLGDRDGVLKAKTAIFQGLPENGRAVLNGDDDKLITVKEVRGQKPCFFSMNREIIGREVLSEKEEQRADVYLEIILDTSLLGSRFIMNIFGESVEAYVPLPGEHMVTNALAAAAVGHLLGLTNEEIVRGIASVKAVDGRSHIIRKDDMTVIDDCYNANPVSVKSAIDLLMSAKGNKTAILGDMFELGEEELALHSQVGEYAARAGVNRLICIGRLSKAMVEGARKESGVMMGGGTCKEIGLYYFPDKESFFEAFMPSDFAGNAVLIKASHGMGFQNIISWLDRTL